MPVVETPVDKAPVAATPAPTVTTPVQEVTEIREEDTSLPYNNSMSVEESCALMTVEEARNYIAPIGSCKGGLSVRLRKDADLR